MKRTLALLVACCLIFPLLASASVETSIGLLIDGKRLSLSQPPVSLEGTLMIPLRPAFEALGATVQWDPADQALVAVREGRQVTVKLGEPTAQVNGQAVKLDRPAELVNGQTMLPLHFVKEALGAEPIWYENRREIHITSRIGGAVTIALTSEPRQLIPMLTNETNSSAVTSLIYDGLVTFDHQMNPVPSLAEGYTIQDDRVYTFTLRDDVAFHDGTPLTSRDVLYTFHAMAHPDYKGPWAGTLDPVEGFVALQERYETIRKSMADGSISLAEGQKAQMEAWESWKRSGGIQAPDARTVVIRLAKPFAPFLTHAGSTSIMPAHLWESWTGDRMAFGPHAGAPVGTGMYRLVSWKRGEIVLERNPDWWYGALRQHPRLQRVTFRVTPGWDRGLIDGGVDVASINSADLPRLRVARDLTIESVPRYSYTYLGYNLKHPLFADVRVRKAITHAVDREGFVRTVLQGHGQVLHSHSVPSRWEYNPAVPDYGYDLKEAERLLDEAGWLKGADGLRRKDGKVMSFTLTTNDNLTRLAAAEYVIRNLEDVGIQAKLKVLPWTEFLNHVDSEAKEAYITGWGMGNDPDPHSVFHSRGEFAAMSYYNSPAVDQLIEQGRSTTDPAKRKVIYQELQRVLAEEQPYTWLFTPANYVVYNKRIQGILVDQIGPRGAEGHLENWYVNP